MAQLKYYNGSSWVSAFAKVWNGSAWVGLLKYYSGSAWVALGATLSVVVAATKSITNFRTFTTPCYSGVRVDNDGDLKALNNTGTTYTSYETWLDAGTTAEVWVQCDIVSGTLTSGTTGSRLATTVDRSWYITRSVTGNKTTVIDLKFYDAASGGNLLDTQRVTLSANYESGA